MSPNLGHDASMAVSVEDGVQMSSRWDKCGACAWKHTWTACASGEQHVWFIMIVMCVWRNTVWNCMMQFCHHFGKSDTTPHTLIRFRLGWHALEVWSVLRDNSGDLHFERWSCWYDSIQICFHPFNKLRFSCSSYSAWNQFKLCDVACRLMVCTFDVLRNYMAMHVWWNACLMVPPMKTQKPLSLECLYLEHWVLEPRVVEPSILNLDTWIFELWFLEPWIFEYWITEPWLHEPCVLEPGVFEPWVLEPLVLERWILESWILSSWAWALSFESLRVEYLSLESLSLEHWILESLSLWILEPWIWKSVLHLWVMCAAKILT